MRTDTTYIHINSYVSREGNPKKQTCQRPLKHRDDETINPHTPCTSPATTGPSTSFEAKYVLNTSRNVSPVGQSRRKVKLPFMTFKMAWRRPVGLCIKFIWNLHFDWPIVWANSTVTYWSDRDIWQLWTIAEMAFNTQPMRAVGGEVSQWAISGHLPSAPPPPPPALGRLSIKPTETYFPETPDENPSGVSLPSLLLLWLTVVCFHPRTHSRALFLLVKSAVLSGPVCSRLMGTISKCVSGLLVRHLSQMLLISVTSAPDAETGSIPISLFLSET